MRHSTPVFLAFLREAKNNSQFALHGTNLFAMLEACNTETGTKVFHNVNIFAQPNCLKISCMDKTIGDQ